MGGFDKKVLLQQINRGSNLYDFSPAEKCVCKSANLSADSTLLAIGYELAGKGAAALFDVNKSVLVHEWKHEKAVWAVRLHPRIKDHDQHVLAVGGWDMMLTLYSTVGNFEALQQIKYKPIGGPAFIWCAPWIERDVAGAAVMSASRKAES